MKILEFGYESPQVALLQTALKRAGQYNGSCHGFYDKATLMAVEQVQRANGILPTGIADPATQRMLMPFYTGFTTQASNGNKSRIVCLDFPLIPTDIPICSAALTLITRGLTTRYPFLSLGEYGRSVMGKPLYYIVFGKGDRRVLYTAAHHANEHITTPLLLYFLEQLSQSYIEGDRQAMKIFDMAKIFIVPCVNPDGVDLVTGDLDSGSYYESAKLLSTGSIPFPSGWKANICGVDLNLQYPAGWEIARRIKFSQGYDRAGPRDYVGRAPLDSAESRALYRLTLDVDPALILAYHSQGRQIYWKYADYEPEGSRELGKKFAALSGYSMEETPYVSGHAGFKDWFIRCFNRPGYTIEVGLGENPLPFAQFGTIYNENHGILTAAALG